MSRSAELVIGVDGGATNVRAHAVAYDGSTAPPRFSLLDASSKQTYDVIDDFSVVTMLEQLAERDTGKIVITAPEREQSQCWLDAAARAIVEVAESGEADSVRIGMGMPGLKTADGRGIAVINNGPRCPDFLDGLQALLREAGLTLAAPIARLGSDADYCGLGEQYSVDGGFRDVEHAYYLGGGTGLAEAMKLGGRLVTFDESQPWIRKAWQMPSALGPTFEQLASASGLNRIYERLGAAAQAPGFVESAAAQGHAVAQSCLQVSALVSAELIVDRLCTVYAGRPEAVHRGEAYTSLQVDHPHRGTVLERVVVGQQIGRIFGDDAFADVFRKPLKRLVVTMIQETGKVTLIDTCLNKDKKRLRGGFLRASRIPAAAALGAGIDAMLNA